MPSTTKPATSSATASPIRRKLSLAVVTTMPPNTTIWDTQVTGFAARRQASSAISYMVKTRVQGRIRWFTIGRHGRPWTPDTARRQALKILADPKHTHVEREVEKTVPNRFSDVAELFFRHHGPKLKLRTLEEYTRLNRDYLEPAFGKLDISTITKAEISRAHASWAEHPRTANHALAVLSKMMSWAQDHGYRDERANPCMKIQRYRQEARERYLTQDELRLLGQALASAEANELVSPFAIAAIRLLIFTGARLSEILTLEWRFIDTERQIAFLPDSKTGRKPLILNGPTMKVLKAMPRVEGNPYVICGLRTGDHLVNLQKPWQLIRSMAGLDDVRLHDLRHTWASHAVAAGGSLPMIGRQLGHAQSQTTQRYAHLADDPVRKLSQQTSTALAQALGSEPK